ncbi:uncharacterized protein LOC144783222 [Lissotriton helveticus]
MTWGHVFQCGPSQCLNGLLPVAYYCIWLLICLLVYCLWLRAARNYKIIQGISLQGITVSQPRHTTVTAGDTATLQCSFNSSEKFSIGGYKWFFIEPSSSSMTEVTNSSEKFSGRVFLPDHTTFTLQQKADVEIHNVQANDTGTYICEVELFTNNSKGCGNGTHLLVQEGKKGTHGQTAPPQQECLHYATLSTKDDKRSPRPCKASEQVVYSRIQTDVQLGVSRRPSQDPDHILYTRVNSITGTIQERDTLRRCSLSLDT